MCHIRRLVPTSVWSVVPSLLASALHNASGFFCTIAKESAEIWHANSSGKKMSLILFLKQPEKSRQITNGNSQMTSKTHRKWRNSRHTGSGDRFWWACVGSWGELTRARKDEGVFPPQGFPRALLDKKEWSEKQPARYRFIRESLAALRQTSLPKKKEVVLQKRELYKSLVNPLHPDLKVLNVRCGYLLSILNPSTDMWDAINGACAQNS